MIKKDDLAIYLAKLLNIDAIHDYCPNGLQVEGRDDIRKIVTGVTACQSLLDQALNAGADAVLVHHGYFWKGESSVITGLKKRRLSTLIKHDMNLFAYHLPLDIHLELGNNQQLAKKLQFNVIDQVHIDGLPLLWRGELSTPVSGSEFNAKIANVLERKPLHIVADRHISQIAWCTGAAQDFIEHAVALNVDAYLTGEVSERTVHTAREYDIHFFAAGHHATERYGIQALGDHLAQRFDLEHEFIDIENPV